MISADYGVRKADPTHGGTWRSEMIATDAVDVISSSTNARTVHLRLCA